MYQIRDTQTQHLNFLKFKIEFPITKDDGEIIHLFAETKADIPTCKQIENYLRAWTRDFVNFKTGIDKTQSIGFMEDIIESEEIVGIKFRISVPESEEFPRRLAITKLSKEHALLIADFIRECTGEEDNDNKSTPANLKFVQAQLDFYKDQLQTILDRINELEKTVQMKMQNAFKGQQPLVIVPD